MKKSNSRHSIIPLVNDTVSQISREIFSDSKVRKCLRDIRDYDSYTYGHSLRVCSLAIRLGSICFLDTNSLVLLGKAAALHDYGKITLDKNILNKNGKLTDDEYEHVKCHASKTIELLREHDFDERVILFAGEHHERVDGSGYPNKLSAEEISVEGKILAVADITDAVTVKRVYNDAGKSLEDAIALLHFSRVDISTVDLLDMWTRTFSPVGELL